MHVYLCHDELNACAGRHMTDARGLEEEGINQAPYQGK
jgi:hypothetical protein